MLSYIGAQCRGEIQKELVIDLHKVASSLLPEFEDFLGKVKDGFKFIEEFKMKSVGMMEPKRMVTFVALGGIATVL